MGIPDHLNCLLRNLYAGHEATVRTEHATMSWVQIRKWVIQGCILSPCLFNLYAEYFMRNYPLDHRKSKSSRKTSISALLTMPKPLTVWITTNRKILKEIGIPDHLSWLLRNLYAGQEATARTGHGTTDWFQVGKGVHQGCILSPCLLNLYAEYIMQSAGLKSRLPGKITSSDI